MSARPHTDLRLSRIGQIAVPVCDLERSIEFYRDKLGVRFLFQAPPGLAFFDCDGTRLMLSVPEPGNSEPGRPASVIYFKVDDVHGAYESLTQRGVEFISEPHLVARMPGHELWMAFFRDPDDTTLALMSEVETQ